MRVFDLRAERPDDLLTLSVLVISDEDGVLTLTMTAASQHLPAIFESVSAAGGAVNETSLRSPNLETLFLLLTGKELRE